MAVPIQLYKKPLFGFATEHMEVRSRNNAPGGADGVDEDVQFRLGADNSPLGKKDRKHGICCGITVAWMIGFAHRRPEATRTDQFSDYFRDVLRFQGAYLKDKRGNIGGIDELGQKYVHDCVRISEVKNVAPQALLTSFPSNSTPVWAAYLAAYHHAIGFGYSNFRYYIMEPNAGLYSYQNKSKFESDFRALIDARRAAKHEPMPGKVSAWFYRAK
ncbi:MAG: hypothetical protein WBC44_09165 [Planctomycetaceae bacterium]